MEQRTILWFTSRVGKLGASRVADAIAKTKTGWGASRANLLAELVAERLTGAPTESFTSAAMQWGTTTEEEARDAYSFRTGADVVEVGFIDHPNIPMTGASPDGLVGDAGLVEIKAPNTATHIDTLLSGSVPGKYITQMMWQMECTGRDWCDFVSYDPRLPESMRLFVRRIDRDDARLAELRALVIAFLAEVDGMVTALSHRYGPEPIPDPSLKRALEQSVYMAG